MGFKKSIPNQYGVTTSYWRVDTVLINYGEKRGEAVLLGYIDQVNRNAGKSPVDSRRFVWEGDDYPFPLNGIDVKSLDGKVAYHIDGLDEKNPLELAYKAIKTKKTTAVKDGREVIIDSEFSDAEDV